MKKLFLAIYLVASLLLNVACWPNSKMVPIGPEAKASLVIYFKAEVTNEERNRFWENVLSRPDPEGKGYAVLEGIEMLAAVRAVQGHEGMSVTFRPSATLEQRERIKKIVLASPIVYKVFENVPPAEIKKLD